MFLSRHPVRSRVVAVQGQHLQQYSKFEMAGRRDLSGGGDDPEESTQLEEAAQRAATLERSIRTRQVGESDSGSFRLPQQSVGVSKGKTPAGPTSSGFGKWGQKLKQAFKGKGRGWGGRQQFQQGRGRPEVEESQQSTTRQPIIPPEYRFYNCNQPGHLIHNCPYPREYGYGR
ncbi:hypothetical protein Taro_002606, partial [Colocasia esculenta]|nr:hypothetical protein [Colocasia esculenta]